MVDAQPVVVADASVVINLNATERAADILAALPFRVVLAEIAADELTEDRRSGRQDDVLLANLVRHGLLELVTLGDEGMAVFTSLVIGPARDTLDDGEAATIAYAVEHGASPAIDERKALKICADRFPLLRPRTTVDLFRERAVIEALGPASLADAIFMALRNARMRVASRHLTWIIEQIGPDRAELCPSLPRSARRP
jgi:predicted nucleic acid-binding protein